MRLEYASVWTRFAALLIDGLLTIPSSHWAGSSCTLQFSMDMAGR